MAKWGTPRDRAENVWESWSDLENFEELKQLVEGHIMDAISNERERCAKIAEKAREEGTALTIAEQIRGTNGSS